MLHRERREEGAHLTLRHVLRMTTPMKPDESPDPMDVGLLGARAVTPLAHPPPHDFHEPQPELGVRRSGEVGLGNERERHAQVCHRVLESPASFERASVHGAPAGGDHIDDPARS